MMKKHLILTFDHELFLGEQSGTAKSCMIDPVNEILDVVKPFGVQKLIFFVDTTYLQKLRENSDHSHFRQDYADLRNQIKHLLKAGHYIYPHIHPHWAEARILENGQWQLNDLTHYRFKDCNLEVQSRIWENSIDILREFGVPNYHPIDGFRAGGWCIQPFEAFKPFFDKYGIKFDFSVLPGCVADTNAQQYDFSGAPLNRSNYRFSSRADREDHHGPYTEFPISVMPKEDKSTFVERMLLRWLHRTGNKSMGVGKGVIPVPNKKEPKQPKFKMISIELLNVTSFRSYKQFIDQHEVIHFISHPKMLSRHNLKYFGKLLEYSSEKYNLDYDFRSLLQS